MEGCSCGVENTKYTTCKTCNNNRIIGGKKIDKETQLRKYPWLVFFVRQPIQYFLRCGGTLVASNYVISAAHCFFDETCDCDEKGENCVNCIVTSQITETGFSVIIGDHDKVRFHFKNWEVSHLWEGPPQKVGFFILTYLNWWKEALFLSIF